MTVKGDTVELLVREAIRGWVMGNSCAFLDKDLMVHITHILRNASCTVRGRVQACMYVCMHILYVMHACMHAWMMYLYIKKHAS